MIPTTILVPVDGSASSQAAELFAAELVNHGGRFEIEVATVIPPRTLPYRRAMVLARTSSEEDAHRAEELLRQAAGRIQAQLTNDDVTVVEQLVEGESPAEAIVQESLEDGTCKLIIMGSRGRGGFGSLALGSVSQQVLFEASCPVIIVKG
jgi:nucleotide-binding universal stress UspA family protein